MPSRDALSVSAITSAAEILMSGCPLDLERMAVGRGTRTIYETVEIVVIKRGAARFHVEVWRSFVPWLWAALVAVAGEVRASVTCSGPTLPLEDELLMTGVGPATN